MIWSSPKSTIRSPITIRTTPSALSIKTTCSTTKATSSTIKGIDGPFDGDVNGAAFPFPLIAFGVARRSLSLYAD